MPLLVVRGGSRGGDQRAFEALVVAGQPRLYRLAYGILRDQCLEDHGWSLRLMRLPVSMASRDGAQRLARR